jgi:large subunit ribosomal protein L7/L12
MADEEVKNEEVAEETPATEETTEAPAEETKEEAPKAEEKPSEEPKKEEKKEEKAEPTGKFADLIKQIETMSVLELSELVKALEDRFGVSAAAPVMMAGAGAPAAGAAAPAEEEKSAYNVVLTGAGGNKIAVIKAVREILPDLGLKEAKDLVDGAPGTVKENMKKDDAQAAKEKLEAAGASVELQ